MQRYWIKIFLMIAVMILMSGCGEQSETFKNEKNFQKVRLVMTANGTDKGIETLTARRFAKLVEEESGGNVHIEFYPNDELTGGNTNEAVRSLTEGAVDLGAYVSGTMSLLDPRLEVATIPWSFSSYQEARKVIDESGGDYYAKVLSEYGLIPSSNGLSTARNAASCTPSETAAWVQSQRFPLSWGLMLGSVMSDTLQVTVPMGNCSFISQ